MNNTKYFPSLSRLSFADFEEQAKPALMSFLTDNKGKLEGGNVDENQALRDMYSLVQGEFPIEWKKTPPLPNLSLSACEEMIVTTSVDVLMCFLGLLGIPDSVAQATASDIIIGLSDGELTALEKSIEAISEADGITDQAKAIIKVMSQIYKVTGIRQILGALEHNMSWYEWVIMGATITAQVAAWVATDFVAALAELVLETAAIGQTVVDAIKTVSVCGI